MSKRIRKQRTYYGDEEEEPLPPKQVCFAHCNIVSC